MITQTNWPRNWAGDLARFQNALDELGWVRAEEHDTPSGVGFYSERDEETIGSGKHYADPLMDKLQDVYARHGEHWWPGAISKLAPGEQPTRLRWYKRLSKDDDVTFSRSR